MAKSPTRTTALRIRRAVLACAGLGLIVLTPCAAIAQARSSEWHTETIPQAPVPKRTVQAPARAAEPDRPLTAEERKAMEVIRVTNAFRRRNGLPEYQIDPVCMAAAADHARDMVRRGFFSHYGPEGSTATSRYQRHNVNHQKVVRITENLGRGNETTPEGALRMWLNSPGHRKHLVGREMDHIGVGVAEGTCFFAACTYYVQCFSNWP